MQRTLGDRLKLWWQLTVFAFKESLQTTLVLGVALLLLVPVIAVVFGSWVVAFITVGVLWAVLAAMVYVATRNSATLGRDNAEAQKKKAKERWFEERQRRRARKEKG